MLVSGRREIEFFLRRDADYDLTKRDGLVGASITKEIAEVWLLPNLISLT
jgi:hypothetical protein